MSNKKITDLPAVPSAQLTDIYETVQGGVSSQETLQQIANLLGLGSGLTSFNNATGAASLATGVVTISSAGVLTSTTFASFSSGNFSINAAGGVTIGGGKVVMRDPSVFGAPAINVNADNNAGNGLLGLTDTGAGHQAYVQFNDGNVGSALFGLAGGAFVLQSNTSPEIAIQHTGGAAGSVSALNLALTGTLTVAGSGTPVTNILSTTAVLDFPSTNAQNSSDLTVTLNGVQSGDCILLGVPNVAMNTNSDFFAWASAANTITVRFNNYSAGAINPASGTFRVAAIRF